MGWMSFLHVRVCQGSAREMITPLSVFILQNIKCYWCWRLTCRVSTLVQLSKLSSLVPKLQLAVIQWKRQQMHKGMHTLTAKDSKAKENKGRVSK